MTDFTHISPDKITGNPFSMIGSDWMLVTAGELSSWNTMTAAWGGFGFLWQKNVTYIFVRPTRYTYEFTERSSTYSLSFFSGEYRQALTFCGTHSGRDTDKAAETGLIPFNAGNGTVGFSQAKLIIICKKLYQQDIDPSRFFDPGIESHYPDKDYHRMYVGEVIDVFSK